MSPIQRAQAELATERKREQTLNVRTYDLSVSTEVSDLRHRGGEDPEKPTPIRTRWTPQQPHTTPTGGFLALERPPGVTPLGTKEPPPCRGRRF